MSPAEDDREAIDRAFADLVAGFYRTPDRPDPLLDQPYGADDGALDSHAGPAVIATETPTRPETDAEPAEDRLAEAAAVPRQDPDGGRDDGSREEPPPRDSSELFTFSPPPAAAPQPAPDEQFVPEPVLPLPRPAWPVLVAWIAMGYAALAVLAISVGVPLPAWAGWLGVVGFVGGFGVLLARLPRHRPPDAGDGAVL